MQTKSGNGGVGTNEGANNGLNDGSTLASPFVMVVEDDPILRGLLSNALQRQGHHVREVENGLSAKSVFDLCHERIELIISDVRMPILGGVDLLKHIRTRSNVPFIVMTGFSEILEAEQAFELGANDFITKPFKSRDLISAIGRCFATAAEAQPSQIKPRNPVYCAVHISECLGAARAVSDVYVQLADDRYLRVAQNAEPMPLERLKIYHERGVDYVFVQSEDFSKYAEFLPRNETDSAVLDTNVEEKAAFLQQTADILAQRCFLDQADPAVVKPAVKTVEDTLSLLVADAEIFDLLANFRAHSERMYAQAIAVAVYALIVARRSGWTSASTQFKIVVSSLLRDIGSQELDAEVLLKSRSSRTDEENRVYESHTDGSRRMVEKLKSLHEDIATIVSQHHQNRRGTGFPSSISEEALHPIAHLIHLIDKFATHLVPLESGLEPLHPVLGLARISGSWNRGAGDPELRYLLSIFRIRNDEIRNLV